MHVCQCHAVTIAHALPDATLWDGSDARLWDVYKAALGIQAKKRFPTVVFSIERRVFEYVRHIYNDSRIRALICFACARIKVDTGRLRSDICFVKGEWFFRLPKGSFTKNFSMNKFMERYGQAGSPLAPKRGSTQSNNIRTAEYSDWQLSVHESVSEPNELVELRDSRTRLLCCPEDQACPNACRGNKTFCDKCEVPLCEQCVFQLSANRIVSQPLTNDNL